MCNDLVKSNFFFVNSKWKEDVEGVVAGFARVGEVLEIGVDEIRARDAGLVDFRGGCFYRDDLIRFCI